MSDTNANRASGRGMLLLAKATAEVRVFASFGRVARGRGEGGTIFGAATFCAFSFGSAKNLLFVSAVGLLSMERGEIVIRTLSMAFCASSSPRHL